MERRGLLGSVLALAAGWFARPAGAQDGQAAEARAKALAAFPFPRITVPGTEALATWERLRREGKGWPVIVGDDEALLMIAEVLEGNAGQSTAAILAAADRTRLPAALEKAFAEENGGDMPGLELGEWPAPRRAEQPGLTVASDILTGKPFARCHIVMVPAADGSEVPAYLRWGAWNACPPPEVHVALLRQWKQRYGAELVGLSGDVLNLRAARRPTTRDAALALAREQYLYCPDIVDQGVGALRPLAASLMESDWWFFWWD